MNTDEKPDGTKTREQENHRRERVEQQDLAREKIETGSTNRRRPPRSKANGEKLIAPDQKKQLFIEDSNKIITGPRRSPPSLPYLIEN
jgi:hypothetical protein